MSPAHLSMHAQPPPQLGGMRPMQTMNQYPHHPDPYASFVPPLPPPLSPTNSRKRRYSEASDPSGMPGPSSAASAHFPEGDSFMGAGQGMASQASGGQPMDRPLGDPTASTKKSRTNTPWTPAEEQRLKNMRDVGSSWSEIAKTFPSRTEGSVKKHWYKDMHYAEFAEDESAALLAAIKEYEASKWKVIGQKLGKPAKYAKEHFGNRV
ncbi:MAG: hypothetical protein M1828_007164 [Chrysothrix sp. TS-e1954]|nr:MAG: hypothetical protein M1828_007164 [Chrysothrix sp. TS-e1954]